MAAVCACNYCFAWQSKSMETKWAVDNLQTIRTLMERSALYRRALAPIMILAGTIGIAGGLIGWRCHIESNRGFVWLWLGVAALALAGALFLVRRQALKDSEPFWSPPPRRVGQAMLPAFLVGLVLAVFMIVVGGSVEYREWQLFLVVLWSWLYGCAVHAAGFFIPRGVRWLGWIPHNQIWAHYCQYTAFVFPSMHDSSGNVLLEALSQGLPVICLDTGGPGAILQRSCGIKVAVENRSEAEMVADLAAAMQELAANPDLRAQKARNALEFARANRWQEVVAGAYAQVEKAVDCIGRRRGNSVR